MQQYRRADLLIIISSVAALLLRKSTRFHDKKH